MQQSNLTLNAQNLDATSESAQATEGKEHENNEEERSLTEDETDELVDIVNSSSASRSVRQGITSGVALMPMDPPMRLFPPDQTGRLNYSALRSGLKKSPVYGSPTASTSAQGERHGDNGGTWAGRRKRMKNSNARPFHIGEDR